MTFEERQAANKQLQGQTFSEYVDDLKYNEKTGLVDVVGKRNLQAEIDSERDSSLDVYLQRFIEDEESDDKVKPVAVANTSLESAYDAMLAAASVAEAYAEEKKIKGASFVDIMRAINNDYKKAKAQAVPEQVKKDEKAQTEQKSE